jgi:hypothetical protein
MIKDANCIRFLVLNKLLQPINITVKQSKVEEIHINGDQVMILKQKK